MAGIKVTRRTNTGNVQDINLLETARPVMDAALQEIFEGIEENLSGKMIHARDSGGKPSTRPHVGVWYDLRVEEGERSRTIHIGVPEGVPSILHNGSPTAWEIKPVNKKSLHWSDESGGDVFAKKVIHPPMPPRPFVEEPVRRVGRKIPVRVREAIRRRLGG